MATVVCLCYGFTDEDIDRACVGAASVEQVCARLGFVPQCLPCADYVRERFAHARAERAPTGVAAGAMQAA